MKPNIFAVKIKFAYFLFSGGRIYCPNGESRNRGKYLDCGDIIVAFIATRCVHCFSNFAVGKYIGNVKRAENAAGVDRSALVTFKRVQRLNLLAIARTNGLLLLRQIAAFRLIVNYL